MQVMHSMEAYEEEDTCVSYVSYLWLATLVLCKSCTALRRRSLFRVRVRSLLVLMDSAGIDGFTFDGLKIVRIR